MKSSVLEDAFYTLWLQLAPGYPEPVRELRFAPPRRWRFDFSWQAYRIAVECQGGTWSRGRHSRGAGQRADAEKNNAAVADGWRILYCTSDMLSDDPATLIAQITGLMDSV